MEAVELVASVIAIVQLSGACLKLTSKLLGPSAHKPETLQSLCISLYGFNGAIRNLQTHFEIHEDDQTRLDALNHLQEPLARCRETLHLLSSHLQDSSFTTRYITGRKFDKKFDTCIRILSDVRELLDLSLACDQLTLVSAVERYVRTIAEDTRDIKAVIQQNEQLLRSIDNGIQLSSSLALKAHEEQSRGIMHLENAIRDAHAGIAMQMVETRSREQREWITLLLLTPLRKVYD